MFWRFGFATTSAIDTLLDRPNLTVEELLDEDDLLQQFKAVNLKLMSFLQQKRVLRRLLQHIVGTAEVSGEGGRDWEEKVRFKYPYMASEILSSEYWPILEVLFDNEEELLVPFWDAILTSRPLPNQPAVPQHQHPLFAETQREVATLNVTNHPLGTAAGAGAAAEKGADEAAENKVEESSEAAAAKPLEVPGSSASEPTTPMESASMGVLGLETAPSSPTETRRVTTARENGPGRSVLAGYWAKVNGMWLEKNPRAALVFIRGLPRITERFVAHLETPAVVDLLYRIIQCEESEPNIGVVEWLSECELIPKVVDLLSPSHSTDLHNTVSELLKAIIALSAPSPANLQQGQEGYGFGGGEGYNGAPMGGVNNRLVRELASEPMVRKMVGFMLDSNLPSQLHRRLSSAAAQDQQLANLTLDDASASASAARTRPSEKAEPMGSLKEDPTSGATSSDESAVDDEDAAEDVDADRMPLTPRDMPMGLPSSTRGSLGTGARGGAGDHRDSTATVRPDNFFPAVQAPKVAVTPESCTSSLVTCISIFIELIRKNNSDYFEQYLFQTLRNHLLQRQQELAEKRAAAKSSNPATTATAAGDSSVEGDTQGAETGKADEDEEMEGMEEAMAELADKLGIVHLGPMLRVLCERLGDFQALIAEPRVTEPIATTLGPLKALTFERYRITELYAELLHCSNMALLNRAPGEGPQYSDEGILQGGIEGLQILARTLQGGDTSPADGTADTTRASNAPTATEDGEGEEEGEVSMDVDSSSEEKAAPELIVTPSSGESDKEKSEEQAQASTSVAAGAALTPAAARSHSRDATRHQRDRSSAGTGSEDTDDEALLHEISTRESEANGATLKSLEDETSSSTNEAGDSAAATAADDDDAQSIRSALSGMSLADLTSPAPSGPPSPIDDAREYTVGDLLKKKFLESQIIPTILRLFFEYPWNNFLHNVVYDILQQFFNGRMDAGLNRRLTLAVFKEGGLTDKIVAGHSANEASLAEARRIRLGYMGHMNLIAEETVKLLERYPHEIAEFVAEHIDQPAWSAFVNETLRENREREAAPLAGGRPAMGRALNFGGVGVGGVPSGDGDIGQAGTAADGDDNDTFANYLSSQMGAGGGGGSDDEDSDEDASWLSQDINAAARSGVNGGTGFDDAFEPPQGATSSGGGGGAQEDDEWGPFSDSGGGDFDFPTSSSSGGGGGEANSSASSYTSTQPNLTPADWAADFQRQADLPQQETSSSSDAGDSTSSAGDEEARTPTAETTPGSAGAEQSGLGGILDSAGGSDAVASAHRRRPSLGQHEAPTSPVRHRRASSGAGSATSETDVAAQAVRAEEPLGPGVAPDAHTNADGMLEREVEGKAVAVPLDEIALASAATSTPSSIKEADESAVVD